MIQRVLPLVLLVVATNIGILASVRGNRAGDPDVLRLTERELSRKVTSERDSSVKLQLNYQQTVNWPRWRDRETLASLGFLCRARAGGAELRVCGLPRRAFLALEYDGPAWQVIAARHIRERDQLLEKVRTGSAVMSQADYLDNLVKFGTRLVVIDASVDPIALRRAHPDRRVIILRAIGRAWLSGDNGNGAAEPVMTGTIDPLTTMLIASGRDRNLLLAAPTSVYGYNGPPRYTVDLKVGRHFEPWIENVAAVDSTEPPR